MYMACGFCFSSGLVIIGRVPYLFPSCGVCVDILCYVTCRVPIKSLQRESNVHPFHTSHDVFESCTSHEHTYMDTCPALHDVCTWRRISSTSRRRASRCLARALGNVGFGALEHGLMENLCPLLIGSTNFLPAIQGKGKAQLDLPNKPSPRYVVASITAFQGSACVAYWLQHHLYCGAARGRLTVRAASVRQVS